MLDRILEAEPDGRRDHRPLPGRLLDNSPVAVGVVVHEHATLFVEFADKPPPVHGLALLVVEHLQHVANARTPPFLLTSITSLSGRSILILKFSAILLSPFARRVQARYLTLAYNLDF